MEVISRIAGGDDPFGTVTAKTAADIAITYLTDSYSRVAVEERNHPKVVKYMCLFYFFFNDY